MILVDPAVWPWRGRRWAHLASDCDHRELHDFAAGLGLRRLAFQGDHYDVDESDRARAVAAGAREVPSRELVRRLRAAGLRRSGPRAALRWQLVGEWPLIELVDDRLPDSPASPVAAELPAGPVAELIRAGRVHPAADLVVRVLARRGEVAAALARPGCDRPLGGGEVLVELAGADPADLADRIDPPASSRPGAG